MRCLFLLFYLSASEHQQKGIRGRKGRKLDGKDNVISVVCDGWLHTPISQSDGFIYVPQIELCTRVVAISHCR